MSAIKWRERAELTTADLEAMGKLWPRLLYRQAVGLLTMANDGLRQPDLDRWALDIPWREFGEELQRDLTLAHQHYLQAVRGQI